MTTKNTHTTGATKAQNGQAQPIIDSPFAVYLQEALQSENLNLTPTTEREYRALKSKEWDSLTPQARQKYIDSYNKLNTSTKQGNNSDSSDSETNDEDNSKTYSKKRQKKSFTKYQESSSEVEKPVLYKRRRGRPPKNGNPKVIIAERKISRRGRPRLVLNAAEVKYIEDFTRELYEAAINDRNLNIQKKPALKKFGLLTKVRETVLNVKTQRMLLKKGILLRFCEWLSPLPDGSLVGNEIRKELLHLLHSLPVRTLDLLECEKQFREEYQTLLEEDNFLYDNMTGGIGKTLLLLWRREDESEENRKTIEKVLEKWYRIVSTNKEDFDIGDYEDMEELEVEAKDGEENEDKEEEDADEESGDNETTEKEN